jgi:hypothetical protein
MGEITVKRQRSDIPNTGGTATITAVSDLANAFCLSGNNRKVSGGWDSAVGTMEADDLAGTARLTAVDTITYERPSGAAAATARFDTEILDYTGAAGGPSEFIVRGRYTSGIISAGVATATVAISGVVDPNRCIPIILGIWTDEATDGANRGSAFVYLDSAIQATVNCGGTSGRVIVRFAVVEFTGSEWSVGHGRSTIGAHAFDQGSIGLVEEADGDTTSGTPFSVGNWDTACIFGQGKGDSLNDFNEAIADQWPIYEPYTGGSASYNLGRVWYQFHADHDSTLQTLFVHVLQHNRMNVQRMSDTQSLGGAMNVTIPVALSDMSGAFVIVSRTSSGTGTEYGRGWVNARITSTTNVELWAHRTGTVVASRIQVVDVSNLTVTRRVFTT